MLAKYIKPSYLGILIGLIGMMFVMACGGDDPTPVPATSTPAPAAVVEATEAPAAKAPEKEVIKFHHKLQLSQIRKPSLFALYH